MVTAPLTLANYSPLISAAFIIFLGFFVLAKGRRTPVSRLFFATTLVFTAWEIGTFMMFIGRNDREIIFWDRFIYLAVVFVPAIQYHFSLAATFYNRVRDRLAGLAYILSVAFLILSRTPYFVNGVFHYRWGVHSQAQIGHHFFLAFFFFYIFAFLYNFLTHLRAVNRPLERRRIIYYIAAFSFLNLVGSLAYLPAYGIPIYPVALISPLVFSILITYAIVLHGLMDIKLIMRRYFVYVLSVTTVLVPAAAILFPLHNLRSDFVLASCLLILILALSVFSRIRKFYYQISNRYFFSSLYDVRELIYDLSICLRSSLKTEDTFGPVAAIFRRSFHNKAMAVLIYNGRDRFWTAGFNDRFAFGPNPKLRLDYRTAVKLFAKNKPLTIDRIREKLAGQKPLFTERLEEWGAAAVVPINIKGRLGDLLLLGEKESGEAYNNGDLKVLDAVATEIGISLENVLLYRQEKEFNKKLREEIAKATRQLQIQNKELQQLDKAKDEFISVVSHQLRTPLTGIRWFAELLQQSPGRQTPEQREWIGQIRASNQRLIRLVNDLLDVSHIETGRKFEIISKSFDLNELIAEVLRDNVALIKTKSLAIANLIPAGLAVEGDRDKIKQVCQNLVSNATKYTPAGKKITIAADESAEGFSFSIADEGIGIPAADRRRLFGKFFRASNAARSDPDGTGLGLYIAREIVRAHGGEMTVESKERQGSTFRFTLPRQLPRTAKKILIKRYEKNTRNRR